MKPSNRLLIALVFSLPFIIICCSGNEDPVSSSNPIGAMYGDEYPLVELSIENGNLDSFGLLGVYELTIDPAGVIPELIPKRGMSIGESFLVEGIGFFTFSPCSDCFQLASLEMHGNDINLTFSIRHPFDPADPSQPPTSVNRNDLDVFDLAVVVDPLSSTPEHFALMNIDVYNYNIVEPDGYTTELNNLTGESAALPYVLVVDDSESVDPHTWNKFAMGAETSVDVEFILDMGIPLSFDLYLTMGYGASAKKPAWKVEILPMGCWFDNQPVPTSVVVKVYDWQAGAAVYGDPTDFANAPPDNVWASSEVESVSVEIPGLTTSLVSVSTPTGGTGMPSDPLIYEIPVINTGMASEGNYTGCVMVKDTRIPLPPIEKRDYLIHKTLIDEDLLDYEIPEYATYQTFAAHVCHEGISLNQYNYTVGPSPDDPVTVDDSPHAKVKLDSSGRLIHCISISQLTVTG